LVIYDASHPSTLQANLGPSFAQWTPFRTIEGGATTSEIKKAKTKKLNVMINIMDEGCPLHDDLVLYR
jgi:hypothetical protein